MTTNDLDILAVYLSQPLLSGDVHCRSDAPQKIDHAGRKFRIEWCGPAAIALTPLDAGSTGPAPDALVYVVPVSGCTYIETRRRPTK